MKKTKILLIFISISSYLLSDSILSKDIINSIQYSKEKIETDTLKNNINWINPIQVKYYYKSNELINSSATTISINQPIFKSGGIYNAIKYSQSSSKYNNINLDIYKRNLIKKATSFLYYLNQTDINIDKINKSISNLKIEASRNKELVFNGFLDVSFLNNSIIALNKNKIALKDLKIQKEDLLLNFNNLSSVDYSSFLLPSSFSVLEFNDFIKNNTEVSKSKANEESFKYLKKLSYSKYLPSVNLTYDYSNDHEINLKTNTTGFNISMPFDFKSVYDIQSSKIAYLKAKKDTDIIKKEQEQLFNTIINKLNIIDSKIKIQETNISYFNSLIKDMKELVNNGIKTEEDLFILKNSRDIEKLNKKLFFIDKLLLILELNSNTNT